MMRRIVWLVASCFATNNYSTFFVNAFVTPRLYHHAAVVSSELKPHSFNSLSSRIGAFELTTDLIGKTKQSLKEKLFPNKRRMLLAAAILLSTIALNQPVVALAMGAMSGSKGPVARMDRYVIWNLVTIKLHNDVSLTLSAL